jgi:hypothetical protein
MLLYHESYAPAIIRTNLSRLTTMPRPIEAHIDLNALENNLRVARRATSSRIMVVVKADGYGHGLMREIGRAHV